MYRKIYKRVVSLFSKTKGVEESTLSYINKSDNETFKKSVEGWNCNCFIDYWWRKKHSVPFGSKVHLEANFIDMYFEWQEDKLYKEIELTTSDPYEPNKGQWLKLSKEEKTKSNTITQEDSFNDFKKEFEELDLSKYDD